MFECGYRVSEKHFPIDSVFDSFEILFLNSVIKIIKQVYQHLSKFICLGLGLRALNNT